MRNWYCHRFFIFNFGKGLSVSLFLLTCTYYNHKCPSSMVKVAVETLSSFWCCERNQNPRLTREDWIINSKQMQPMDAHFYFLPKQSVGWIKTKRPLTKYHTGRRILDSWGATLNWTPPTSSASPPSRGSKVPWLLSVTTSFLTVQLHQKHLHARFNYSRSLSALYQTHRTRSEIFIAEKVTSTNSKTCQDQNKTS